jgi:hypothetical protein
MTIEDKKMGSKPGATTPNITVCVVGSAINVRNTAGTPQEAAHPPTTTNKYKAIPVRLNHGEVGCESWL